MAFDFSLDWYGTYARHSAVADLVESRVIAKGAFNLRTLGDEIRDNGWTRRLNEKFVGVISTDPAETEVVAGYEADDLETLGEAHDAAQVAADSVIATIQERSEKLGAHYPFTLSENAELIACSADRGDTLYEALLGISLCHAADQRIGTRKACYVFEDTVERWFESAGFRSIGLGRISRDTGTFGELLQAAGREVGLSTTPEGCPYRADANEEGTDVLCNFWDDNRVGGLQLVGQVTCARSNDWERKMAEVKVPAYKSWLGRNVDPIAFLAIPHHADHPVRFSFIARNGRDIVDRVRLSGISMELNEDEKSAVGFIREGMIN